MAPLPPNNTNRLFIDYNDGQHAHTLLVRYAPPADLAFAMELAHNIWTALAPTLYLITIEGARASPAGTNLTLPVEWTGDPTYGAGDQPAVTAPRQICFLGRSATGRKARWFIFGFEGNTPENYRIAASESTAIANTIAGIQASGPLGAFLAIDGQETQVYPYVDVNYNSYWEAEART